MMPVLSCSSAELKFTWRDRQHASYQTSSEVRLSSFLCRLVTEAPHVVCRAALSYKWTCVHCVRPNMLLRFPFCPVIPTGYVVSCPIPLQCLLLHHTQVVPCSSGSLTLTSEDCRAFATYPLAPVNIMSYVRNVTRRDKGA